GGGIGISRGGGRNVGQSRPGGTAVAAALHDVGADAAGVVVAPGEADLRGGDGPGGQTGRGGERNRRRRRAGERVDQQIGDRAAAARDLIVTGGGAVAAVIAAGHVM